MSATLNLLVKIIISNYLNKSRCLLIFSETNFDLQVENPVVRLSVNTNGTFRHDVLFHNYGCQDIFIQAENPSQVIDNFEELIRKRSERFGSRRFLVITSGHGEEFKDVFKSASLRFIADLLVVLPKFDSVSNKTGFIEMENDVTYEFWTHEFRGSDDNFRNSVLVDIWFSKNSSFLFNNNLYPDKISDQMGKPLRLATITYPPYAFIGKTVEESGGSELGVAKMYAEKHNMTVEFVGKEEEKWGDISNNWTGDGILGNMVMDIGDFGFAGLYQWEDVFTFLDFSTPSVRAGVTCLVPSPKLSAGWLMPVFSYTISMWIGLGVMVLFSSFYLWYLEIKSQKSLSQLGNSMFIVLGIFLLQPLSHFQLQKRMFIKYFILSLLVVSLFISTSYSSGLASSMTIPRYDDPINTVEDLAHSGLFLGATSVVFIITIENATEENYKLLVQRFLVLTEEELALKTYSRSFALVLERSSFGHYAIGNFITEETVEKFNIMVEDLYWDHSVLVTRRNSVLLPSLDSLILRITASGLGSYWELKVAAKDKNNKLQDIIRNSATSRKKRGEFIKLSWMYVEGAFGILAIGTGAAFVCFIGEHIVYGIKFRKKLFLPYQS